MPNIWVILLAILGPSFSVYIIGKNVAKLRRGRRKAHQREAQEARAAYEGHAQSGGTFKVLLKRFEPSRESDFDVRYHRSARYWVKVGWEYEGPREWWFNVPPYLFDRIHVGDEIRDDDIAAVPE